MALRLLANAHRATPLAQRRGRTTLPRRHDAEAKSLGLFVLAGACWVPVAWLQLRMLAVANKSSSSGSELPKVYWQCARWRETLGYPAFAAMLIVTYLMVVKPAFSR